MPGKHKFDLFRWVQIASKLEKSTYSDYILISSDAGEDKSACKISGHPLQAFSLQEMPGNPKFDPFH